MSGDDCQIIHIPCKPQFATDQQPTVNVLASFIEPKFANILVRKLNQVAPLENLRHVKRVRKEHLDGKTRLSIILCLAGDGENEMDGDCRQKDVHDLINSYQLSSFVTQVCKYAATSKEEWDEQCRLWPTSFHPPTYNIEGISGFSEDGSKSVLSFMKSAIELATSGLQLVNAAMIVDPASSQVISSACDEICSWRSPHCKKCTENFPSNPLVNGCSSTRKKFRSNDSLDDPASSHVGALCLNPWLWSGRHLPSSSSSYWHPLRHAAMVAIEYSADRDRHLYPARVHVDDEPIQVGTQDLPSKRIKGANGEKIPANVDRPDSDRPYLCTGYDIYLAWEPCMMCAMALVHQRIRRIFYAFPNLNTGSLGSVFRLQGEKSLNHHYAVFQVKLSDSIVGSVKAEMLNDGNLQQLRSTDNSDIKEA